MEIREAVPADAGRIHDIAITSWLDTYEEIDHLAGHDGTVATLSAQGQTMVSSGFDTTIRVWDLGSSRQNPPPVLTVPVSRFSN